MGQPRVTKTENNPYTVQTNRAANYAMLNEENFVRQLNQARPVPKRRTDFGSTLRRHDETHQRFYNMTQYSSNHSRPLHKTAQNVIEGTQKANKRAAGINHRPHDQQGNKTISALTGELFKTEDGCYEHG